MSCDYREKISSLIDGELSPVEAREVERHLLNCGECEEARAGFLDLRSQIISIKTRLTPAVQNRALAKILPGANGRSTSPARSFGWRWGPVAAFATILIVGAITGLLLYQNPNHQAPQSQTVAMGTASPVPSASVEKESKPVPSASLEKESKPEEGGSGGTEQPQTEKGGNELNAPRRGPSTPIRRPSPVVREPKPGEQFATIPDRVRSADSETMTAMHFEKSETLLRAFRNVRLNEPGTAREVRYERKRAQQLVYQNMMLRREADVSGDVQTASLLESLEPILLDIANLPDQPDDDAVRVIRERAERKNIVALLQVNSIALARAFD